MARIARVLLVLTLAIAVAGLTAHTAAAGKIDPGPAQIDPGEGGGGPPPTCDEGHLGYWWAHPSGYWFQCVRGAFGYEWVNSGQRWDGGCGVVGTLGTVSRE